jgi:hypothetical protein
LGEVADGDRRAGRNSFDREQGLMLARRQARRSGGVLAERQKSPDMVAKFGQRFVVRLAWRRSPHGSAIFRFSHRVASAYLFIS